MSILLKYNFLYEFLNENILLEAANHIEEILPFLSNSWERDPYHTQFAMTNSNEEYKTDRRNMDRIWDELLTSMRSRHSILLNILEENPQVTWHKDDTAFSIVTNSLIPVSDITLTLDSKVDPDQLIYYDKDNNGIISDSDLLLPTIIDKNKITVLAEFITNRATVKNSIENWPFIKLSETQFNLLLKNKTSVIEAEAKNPLTGKQFKISNIVNTLLYSK